MQNIQIQSERKEIAFLFGGKSISMDAIGNPTLRETIRRNVLPLVVEGIECGNVHSDHSYEDTRHREYAVYFDHHREYAIHHRHSDHSQHGP